MVCVCLCVCFWCAIQVMVQWKTMSWTQTNFWKEARPSLEGKFPFRAFPHLPPLQKIPQVILNCESRFLPHQEAGELHCHERALRYQLRLCMFLLGGGIWSQKTSARKPPQLGDLEIWFSTWWIFQASMRPGAEGLLGGPQWLDVFLGQIHPRG